MATHSSNLAWKIPWTEEPGRLQSLELQRVWHDWATITINYSHYFYIRFLDIIHFIAESLPAFTNLSLSPPFPVLSSHFSTLYFYNFDFFGLNSTYKEYHVLFVFLCLTYYTY